MVASAADSDPLMSSKSETYALLGKQISSLLEGETDPVACLANAAAAIKEAFGWWWVGFYRVCDHELVLGPFQGPAACTRIPYGKGVCGAAWERGDAVIVPDVAQFPGHIACSSESRSEIVVPLMRDGQVLGVLDIDSRELGSFDGFDAVCLGPIAAQLAEKM